MPIRIFSKALAEKHDEFISRMYEGMVIEGSTAIDYQVRPPQNKFQDGSFNVRWTHRAGEVNTYMVVSENGTVLNMPETSGEDDDGSSTFVSVLGSSSSTNAFGTYLWNDAEERYEKTGYNDPSLYYLRISTSDAGSTFTMTSHVGTNIGAKN